MGDNNDTVFICDFCHKPFVSHKDDNSATCWECMLKQIEELPNE